MQCRLVLESVSVRFTAPDDRSTALITQQLSGVVLTSEVECTDLGGRALCRSEPFATTFAARQDGDGVVTLTPDGTADDAQPITDLAIPASAALSVFGIDDAGERASPLLSRNVGESLAGSRHLMMESNVVSEQGFSDEEPPNSASRGAKAIVTFPAVRLSFDDAARSMERSRRDLLLTEYTAVPAVAAPRGRALIRGSSVYDEASAQLRSPPQGEANFGPLRVTLDCYGAESDMPTAFYVHGKGVKVLRHRLDLLVLGELKTGPVAVELVLHARLALMLEPSTAALIAEQFLTSWLPTVAFESYQDTIGPMRREIDGGLIVCRFLQAFVSRAVTGKKQEEHNRRVEQHQRDEAKLLLSQPAPVMHHQHDTRPTDEPPAAVDNVNRAVAPDEFVVTADMLCAYVLLLQAEARAAVSQRLAVHLRYTHETQPKMLPNMFHHSRCHPGRQSLTQLTGGPMTTRALISTERSQRSVPSTTPRADLATYSTSLISPRRIPVDRSSMPWKQGELFEALQTARWLPAVGYGLSHAPPASRALTVVDEGPAPHAPRPPRLHRSQITRPAVEGEDVRAVRAVAVHPPHWNRVPQGAASTSNSTAFPSASRYSRGTVAVSPKAIRHQRRWNKTAPAATAVHNESLEDWRRSPTLETEVEGRDENPYARDGDRPSALLAEELASLPGSPKPHHNSRHRSPRAPAQPAAEYLDNLQRLAGFVGVGGPTDAMDDPDLELAARSPKHANSPLMPRFDGVAATSARQPRAPGPERLYVPPLADPAAEKKRLRAKLQQLRGY
jgi:hypothetical protein